MSEIFLTAQWRKLAMANYVVDPSIVTPYLPVKTELDFWNNHCYLSLVAFMFLDTKVKGCSIPFHRDFEEVNLRFYVRYKEDAIWKRGVVFIREFVPLPMVTSIANHLYQERYRTVPMKHHWVITPEKLQLSYYWKRSQWNSFSIDALNDPKSIPEGSEEEFITQHFWGYSQKTKHTSEYQVDHEAWKSYSMNNHHINVDFSDCYGKDFRFLNGLQPSSVFLVDGSAITVYKDRKIL